MPQNADELVDLLSVEPVARDRYRGHPPASTTLAKTYGGQIMAQALVAATNTVPGRPAHSCQAFFISPADAAAPVTYEVERLREGRSISSRVVRASQDGRLVARLFASFQVPEDGLEHTTPPSAQVPAPHDVPALQDVMAGASALNADAWRHEWAALDIRYHADRPIEERGGPGIQRLWVRVRDRLPDDPTLHRALIAYLSDLTLLAAALRPHGLMLGAPDLPRATMNHTIWFHEDARADEWLLFDQHSPWAGGARGLSVAGIHTRDGRRIGSLAQEGLIRLYGDLRDQLLPRRQDT